MKDGDIIVIDSVRRLLDDKQQTAIGRIITDKAGNETKIKKGQGGKLEDRWGWLDENAGKAIKLTVRDFMPPKSDKAYPFVADFEVVEDVFVAQATEKAQAQTKDARENSIEAQVAFKGMIELMVADRLSKEIARATVDWAMARIALPSVIVTKIEEAKGETNKNNKATVRQEEGSSTRPIGDKVGTVGPVTNAGTLFSWIMSKDPNIKAPRVWVQTKYNLSDKEVITDQKAVALYKTIKTKEKW